MITKFDNLFTILQSRIYLQNMGLKSIQVSSKTITLKFDNHLFETNHKIRDQIIDFFIAHPKKYQLNPDYTVYCYFKKPIEKKDFLYFSKNIAEQIFPC